MLTLSIVASRYGSGVLEDNFVARIYTSYDSGGQFLALYTVLNCYVYVLVTLLVVRFRSSLFKVVSLWELRCWHLKPKSSLTLSGVTWSSAVISGLWPPSLSLSLNTLWHNGRNHNGRQSCLSTRKRSYKMCMLALQEANPLWRKSKMLMVPPGTA